MRSLFGWLGRGAGVEFAGDDVGDGAGAQGAGEVVALEDDVAGAVDGGEEGSYRYCCNCTNAGDWPQPSNSSFVLLKD